MALLQRGNDLFVSSKTGSGKSVVFHVAATQAMDADPHHNKIVVYLGVTKALAQQKYEEWSSPDHPWHGIPKALVTGDTSDDPDREQRIGEAVIICMTPESLLSRILKKNTKGRWVNRISLIGFDEVHTIGSDGRGGTIENLLMSVADHLPTARVLGLSGTFKNLPHFMKWWRGLGRRADELVSDYQAVPIHYHFVECAKVAPYSVQAVLEDIPSDHVVLVGVWSKQFGRTLTEWLAGRFGQDQVAFHCADVSRQERASIERRLQERSLRIVVCTSTLFVGINSPVDDVVITATHVAGKAIPMTDIMQAAGRAGRKGHGADRGDVHFMASEDHIPTLRELAHRGQTILSAFHHEGQLAMHLLYNIWREDITADKEAERWGSRTFAYSQLTAEVRQELLLDVYPEESPRQLTFHLGKALDFLIDARFVMRDGRGNLTCTAKGDVCAFYMIDPLVFDAILGNIDSVADNGRVTPETYGLIWGPVPGMECLSGNGKRFSHVRTTHEYKITAGTMAEILAGKDHPPIIPISQINAHRYDSPRLLTAVFALIRRRAFLSKMDPEKKLTFLQDMVARHIQMQRKGQASYGTCLSQVSGFDLDSIIGCGALGVFGTAQAAGNAKAVTAMTPYTQAATRAVGSRQTAGAARKATRSMSEVTKAAIRRRVSGR